jgi:3-deoxy-D-manno-octulosonic-acid transferase
MGKTVNTSSITVSMGHQQRLYQAFVTSAPARLDTPSTVTLHAASLGEVRGLAADPIQLATEPSTTRARLVLVAATELAWQRARYRETRHILAPADPVLVGPDSLQRWLWQRLHSATGDTCPDRTTHHPPERRTPHKGRTP